MKLKESIFALFIFIPILSFPQKQFQPTMRLEIKGAVKQERIIKLDDFYRYSEEQIGDVVITNHLGERKGVAKALKGVSVKKVLSDIKFTADNPKQLSEFYLTFVASDGYKVVYSWNEIFNSATGDQTFFVTEKEGKKLSNQPERILLVTRSDEKTGRRYVKGLEQVIVSRVQ